MKSQESLFEVQANNSTLSGILKDFIVDVWPTTLKPSADGKTAVAIHT